MTRLMAWMMAAGLSLAATSVLAQDRLSLIEVAKQRGLKEATVMVDVELPPMRLPELVDESVLVTRGRVVRMETHLADDQSLVYTDYVVVPIEVLKQTNPVVAATPGPMPGIVVRKLGGSVKVGEYTLRTHVESEAWEVPLRIGDEYLMFLSRGSSSLSSSATPTVLFNLTNAHLSVFAVRNDRLESMTAQATSGALLGTSDRVDDVLAQVRNRVAIGK